jgi:hypothetical protein
MKLYTTTRPLTVTTFRCFVTFVPDAFYIVLFDFVVVSSFQTGLVLSMILSLSLNTSQNEKKIWTFLVKVMD